MRDRERRQGLKLEWIGIAFVIILGSHGLARAQAPATGVITGVVLDQEDRQPLPNARVGVYRFDSDTSYTMVTGSLTGADGRFRFEVPPGTYRVILSYQSYSVVSKDDVVVGPGATVEVETALTPKPFQIKGIDVKGEEVRGTEASSLANQKKASFVSDAITAEQIAKSTDSNAAEALQRVTGLSVVNGRYVYVRGLGERYSSTLVNGASVGTPEPNKRVVPLDIFPSGALAQVTVQKSYSPDQDAEFAGGVIELETRDIVEGKRFTQNFSTGYAAGTLRRKFLSYEGGKLDFLGYDDGTRRLPDLIRNAAGDRRITQRGVFGGDGFTPDEVAAFGRSFNKTWSPEKSGGRLNYSYAASYGRSVDLAGHRLGFLASLSLNNGFNTVVRENNAYSGTDTRLTPLYLYRVGESSRRVLGGGLVNLSLGLSPANTIRVRTLYTRQTEDYARIMEGPNFNFGTDRVRITSLDFVERGLFSGVLSGDHTLRPLGNTTIDWKASYSEAQRDEPDRRENVYESNGQGGLALSSRASIPLTRVFGDMNEYDRSVQLNVVKPISLAASREARLKIGTAVRKRNRTSAFRRLGFRLGTQGRQSLDTTLPPESLLVDENIKPGYFELQEETRENDTYRAGQDLIAGYAMAEVPVTDKLRMMGGARIERSSQSVEAKSPFVTTASPVDVLLENTDVLPAVNATYRARDNVNVRAGFSVTVSRPELREMSPFDIYDYETGYSEVGNTSIHRTRIQNYDLRGEAFLGTKELVAVSAFRKVLFEPIENVVEGSSGGYILSPRNGRDGRLAGIELEARLGLRRLWDALDRLAPIPASSSALDHWAMSANLTRVDSRVRVKTTTDGAGNPVFRTGPLQGQSTYSLNAALYFGSERFEGALLYTAFGRRLAQVGAGAYPSSLPDIYEYPLQSLDLSLAQRINHAFQLKLTGDNLLDRSAEFRQLDQITRRLSPGRTYSISVQAKN